MGKQLRSGQERRATITLQPSIGGYNPLRIAQSDKVLTDPAFSGIYAGSISGNGLCESAMVSVSQTAVLAVAQIVVRQFTTQDALYPAAALVFILTRPQTLRCQLCSERGSGGPHSVDSTGRARWPRQTALASCRPVRGLVAGRKAAHSTIFPRSIAAKHSALYLRFAGGHRNGADYGARPGSKPIALSGRLAVAMTAEVRLGGIAFADLEQIEDPTVSFSPPPSSAVRILDAYVESDAADENDLVRIMSRRANSVEVEIGNLPEGRILTFVDAAYPGWTAYVDSRPAPLYIANDAFKAVVLQPGAHTVRFVYFLGAPMRHDRFVDHRAAVFVLPMWSCRLTRETQTGPVLTRGSRPASRYGK